LNVSIEWHSDLRFTGRNERGQLIEIDATEIEGEAKGVTPMQLLLVTLGGCTAIDVVNILHKQRQTLTGLTVNLSGERRKDPPRYFEKIHIEYMLTGHELEKSKVERAIMLSQQKYCSVEAMLKGVAAITASYKILKK